ncbi:MAG: haloacid dehalogenase [Planctomycetaceae bacterium]|nr:haloacid dehalogenase [Planctomycetaceae bacterium]
MDHEQDYTQRYDVSTETHFLPDSSIEIIRDVQIEGAPKFALFDFDGTLSLVRAGWVDVMVPLMVHVLKATQTDETEEELAKMATAFVMELTGKQTIYQMIRLAEEVSKRRGIPLEPIEYKLQYHEALMESIQHRRDELESGRVPPERYLVAGSFQLLDDLQSRGVELYLASGTDENYVREEVELLGLSKYFGNHVYGAIDDYKNFSKQMVIDRILTENNVEPSRLVGFGDGYVEIDNVKSSGGIAIGVASDESASSGEPDPWKRDRLIAVGADVIVPDFAEAARLMSYLCD